MDKIQKQLVDTYFRKRNIANEQNGEEDGAFDENSFTHYEVGYILSHDISIKIDYHATRAYIDGATEEEMGEININNLKTEALMFVLLKNFKIFYPKASPEQLAELSANEIYTLAWRYPEYTEKLDLSKIDNNGLIYILVNKFIFSNVMDSISRLPLEKLNYEHKMELLTTHPELKNYLK